MSIFKYFWDGGRVNHYMKKYIRQDQEIIDFVEKKNYNLDIVELFLLRNLVLRKGVESETMSQKEAIEKCGNKESFFGYSWVKSIVEEALSIEIIVVDNPFKNKNNSNVK
jgi:hypothetical protein